MNNAQFRKLLETPRLDRPSSLTSGNGAPSTTPALGSKLRSSIPMTPRSLSLTTNNDFARQLAAHRAAQQQKPVKKFRSSAAPKGSKLGESYVDRSKALREEDAIEDERERRLKALEELVKEGAIDREEYEKQTKLLGGDIKSTHLVKGLDFALLQRVKAGENVLDEAVTKENEEELEEELEDKLEQALESEVTTVERKKEKEKGEKAPAPKTRAEILAELKKQRQAQKEASQPQLGSKFRKIGDPKPEEKKDEEIKVKLVMGADGKVKRKVRRRDKEKEKEREQEKAKLDMPPPHARIMGMIPPPPLPGAAANPEEVEDEDDDIFAGAADYDPLAGLDDNDEDSADEEPTKRQKSEVPLENASPENGPEKLLSASSVMLPPPRPRIDYFNESDNASRSDDTYGPPADAASLLTSNPELAAALAKASKLKPLEESDQEKRRKAIMEAHERDSYDIDMGFGGSTNFDDDEDEGMGGGGAAKTKKRKRGGGKKKGDKNDAGVVGKIVEEKYGKN